MNTHAQSGTLTCRGICRTVSKWSKGGPVGQYTPVHVSYSEAMEKSNGNATRQNRRTV